MVHKKKPSHESMDTIHEGREFAYRAPSPDSEPPQSGEFEANPQITPPPPPHSTENSREQFQQREA